MGTINVLSKIRKLSFFSAEIYHFFSSKISQFINNLKYRPIFIGSEHPRDQSIDCHIHWLRRACRCILVTKIRINRVSTVEKTGLTSCLPTGHF